MAQNSGTSKPKALRSVAPGMRKQGMAWWISQSGDEKNMWREEYPEQTNTGNSITRLWASLFPVKCKQVELERYGFVLKERDYRVNPGFAGKFMVLDQDSYKDVSTTECYDFYAIVGNDRNALINEAHEHCIPTDSRYFN